MQEIAACSQHHTEVSLVTDWSPNLSFWSMMPAVTQLTQAAPLPRESYSPNHTYVAIIASDGDSVQVSCLPQHTHPTRLHAHKFVLRVNFIQATLPPAAGLVATPNVVPDQRPFL